MRKQLFLSLMEMAKKDFRDFLFEHESKELLKSYGLNVTNFLFLKSREEIEERIREIIFPCVLKIVSRDALHKSNVGGVIIGIKNKEELLDGFSRIEKIAKNNSIKLEGVLIEEQAKEGIEAIIGLIKDRVFGHVLMLGLGGVYTEVLKEVSFRIIPATRRELLSMIYETKLWSLLNARYKKVDVNVIVEALEKVSLLAEENPEILELDINPVFVYEDFLKVIDARIRFASV